MKLQGLFIYGIFESVLREIYDIHTSQPDLTLYLQPYSGSRIKMLRANPPTPNKPTRLYLSVSHDPHKVLYTADIVGWEDKSLLTPRRFQELNSLIKKYQPGEGGLYDKSKMSASGSRNVVHIQYLTKLHDPFSISNLIKISDGKPYSTDKQSSGGWSEVRLV